MRRKISKSGAPSRWVLESADKVKDSLRKSIGDELRGTVLKSTVVKGKKISAHSDASLMLLYSQGKQQAFECLYRRHGSALFAFLKRHISQQHIAEELAHDTWLAVIKQAKIYQPDAAFRTWLYRIAHNRLVDHWRRFSLHQPGVLNELSEAQLRVEDSTEQGIIIDELATAISSLSAEQLSTVLLRIEGFSRDEIAEITDTKPETVKSRLRYANQHLRNTLEVTA